jgi:hypothetical protein
MHVALIGFQCLEEGIEHAHCGSCKPRLVWVTQRRVVLQAADLALHEGGSLMLYLYA